MLKRADDSSCITELTDVRQKVTAGSKEQINKKLRNSRVLKCTKKAEAENHGARVVGRGT